MPHPASKSDSHPSNHQVFHASNCPACGHHVAVPFFDGGQLPLTTLAWPEDPPAAQELPRLPHTFVRCVDCGHVYNRDFNYADVPYSDKPNLMFNDGAIWTEHLNDVCRILLDHLPPAPTVVEVGCGNGQLLRALAEKRPRGRYIGFDPNGHIDTSDNLIEARVELFEPSTHVRECRADVIISRHVLEHLMNPLAFLQALGFAASYGGIETRLFLEVPCIDQVLARQRTVDFFYEHNSHFTTESFTRMLERCATEVELIRTAYNHEVIFGLARVCQRTDQVKFAEDAEKFRLATAESRRRIQAELDQLARSGRQVAIWGGTGKAAAFINQYGLDCERFPCVVDSDRNKIGTFVPGTGQQILPREVLIKFPADVILIATQWRAADIVWEMQNAGIQCEHVLIEHKGRLCNYHRDAHPYRSLPPVSRIDPGVTASAPPANLRPSIAVPGNDYPTEA